MHMDVDPAGPTLPRPGLISTHGHVSFAEITALTPERLVQFDAALVAFVRHWLSPTLGAGYKNQALAAALTELLAEYGVWFSLKDTVPYVSRGRELGVALGVRVGSFMAHHSVQFVKDDHHRSFICWQVVHELLVFRGLETAI